MNWLTQYIVGRELDKMLRENPEKVIRGFIKKYLPEKYLSTRPSSNGHKAYRKTKRSNGAAII